MLDIIKGELLSEEAMEAFIQETALALKEKQSEQKPEYEAYNRSVEDAKQQITNIMTAIRAGIITPTTKAELEKAEAEHAKAESLLKAHSQITNVLTSFLPKAAERYRAMVGNLSQALYTDVGQARQHLKELMGQIRLLPSMGGKSLEAELRYNAEGLMNLALGKDIKVGLVAGARFELTTFRL